MHAPRVVHGGFVRADSAVVRSIASYVRTATGLLATVVVASIAVACSMLIAPSQASSLGGIGTPLISVAQAPAPDLVPPAVPTVTVTPGDQEVLVEWTGSPDTSSWLVHIDGTLTVVLPAGTGSYLATGLTNDTAYLFEVYAEDAAGNVSQPGSATGTPTAPPGP